MLVAYEREYAGQARFVAVKGGRSFAIGFERIQRRFDVLPGDFAHLLIAQTIRPPAKTLNNRFIPASVLVEIFADSLGKCGKRR